MTPGRALLILFTSTLLASSVYSQVITDFSVYNETYFWNGQLVIPYPSDPRESIQAGRIFVQLPNVTTVLDTRIGERVDTTIDCGLRIAATLDTIPPGTPSRLIGHRTTTWFRIGRRPDGTLETGNTTIVNTAQRMIYGTNSRYLRIPRPILTSRDEQGNEGIFICRFCYDLLNVFGGGVANTVCDESRTELNITSDPPTIRRVGGLVPGAFRIGTNICLDSFRLPFIRVVCAQNHSISVEPSASYTLRGLPATTFTGSIFGFGQDIAGEIGQNVSPLVVVGGIRSMFTDDSGLTCTLSNRFGEDVETSRFLYDVSIASFTGSINGASGTQCTDRPPNVICPRIGQTVSLNCLPNNMNSYNITGNSRSGEDNMNISFTVTANDYGNYTCTSSNECNSVSRTVVIEQCTLPVISLRGPRLSDDRILPTRCFPEILEIAGANTPRLDCRSVGGGTVTRRWYIDGVLDSRSQFDFPMRRGGNYTCTLTNDCGTVTSTRHFHSDPPMIRTGVGIRETSPVDIGHTACVNASEPSIDVQISCAITNPDGARIANRRWDFNGAPLNTDDETINANMLGTYTCEAWNDCGNVSNSTDVVYSPSIIEGSGNSNTSNVRIGADGCLRRGVQLLCDLPGSLNLPRRWYVNGALSGTTGRSFSVSNMGTYRCEISNECGTESATSVVRDDPMSSISGAVANLVGDDGCIPRNQGGRICANVGQNVTISCTARAVDGYTIRGPRLTVSDMPLTFIVTSADYGTYTCTSSNPCNSAVSTISLQVARCDPPSVTVSVSRESGASAPNCYRSDNDLFVSCVDSVSGSTVVWYINGTRQSNTNNRQQVTVPGNYTCVTTAACGAVVQNETIILDVPSIDEGSSSPVVTNPGNTPVRIGSSTCISRQGSGSSVRITCAVSNQFVEPFQRVWQRDGTSINTNAETITATSSGRYTCSITNQCGTDSASSNVISRPEIRKGQNTDVSTNVNIGGTVCLESNPGMIRCDLISGSGTLVRRWLNGSTVISGQTGATLTVRPSDVGTSFTCQVSNECSMDSATTAVTSRVPATVSGTIMGLSGNDNGCNRPGITATNVDLCPLDGETVNITCQPMSGMATIYFITGPGNLRSENVPLVIMNFDFNVHTGTYTCTVTAANPPAALCGATEVMLSVGGSGVPPVVSTLPPFIGGNPPTLPPNVGNGSTVIGSDICITPAQSVTIQCNTVRGTPPINFTWTRPPNQTVLSRSENLTVSELGTYECTATNTFGSSSANTTVFRLLDVNLTAMSPAGNRCSGLKRPPTGIDHCAFLNDRLYLNCSTDDPEVRAQINPDGTSDSILFESVLEQHMGMYMCNASNECGPSSDAVTIGVYDPARISRVGTLPPPGPGEVVEGANRQTDPTTVPDNSTVILHCPYTGIERPNTTWYRIRRDGYREAIDTNDPTFSVSDNGTNLVLTITGFNSSLQGTYRCFTTNNAGDEAGDVVLQIEIPVVPVWVTSPWTRCTPMCHTGMRMRMVECQNNVTGLRIPDNRCPDPKPLTTDLETCRDLGPCFRTPIWYPGDWSECSASCNGGHRQRTVQCIVPATGETVKDRRCPSGTRPHYYEYCNTHPCCIKDQFQFCRYYTHECHKDLMRKHHCCWTCRGY